MKRMRRPWRLSIPRLALAAIAAGMLAGPAAAASGVRVVGLDSSGYPELRATVLAPTGSAAPTLRENNVRVTGLAAVNLGKAKSVVLAVDRSESMRGAKLAAAIAGARAFVAARAPGDQIEVITFGHHASALTSFSSSGVDAGAALAGLQADNQPGTALWDAVALAAKHLGGVVRPGHVIIVLTDGQDVSSSTSFDAAIAAANAAHASVYPIGISGKDYTPDPLRELASRTGGTYHEAASSAQLAGVYASIGRVLSHAWELTYLTAARPGDTLRLFASVPGAGTARDVVTLDDVQGASAPGAVPPAVLPGSMWRSPLAPVAITAAVGLLILLSCGFWFGSRQGRWVRTRLAPHLARTKDAKRARRKRHRREALRHIIAATEETFSNFAKFRALQRLLERADLPLRAAELLYLCLGSAVLTVLIGAIVTSAPLFVLIFLGVGAALPIMFVKFKAGSRIKAFDNQLPDLLITISASLKAGHSFRHAIQAVVDEGAQPTAKEFTRVLTETQLGRPMDAALDDMAERVGSKNLRFVITAVTIQRQVGGSLAGLFDMVAETVRQRQQFIRKIRGLTSMGKMSAYVLIGLPIFIALVITIINPTYMEPLYHSSTGHMLIFVGFVMIGIGSLILKKIVSFKG